MGSKEALGQRIQNARKNAGLTQQQLCHKAGLSYSTLAKIERGAIAAPSIFTIQNIAAATGVGLDELIGHKSAKGKGSAKKRSKSGITFVYFDINGCLVRFFHRAFARIAHDYNLRADIVETAFWHFNDQICRGEISLEEFNKKLAKKLNISKLDWTHYYFEAIEPVEGTDKLVSWVAENYSIGLLSNIAPGFIDKLLKQGIIPNVKYDSIVDSSVAKAIKPEQKIYEIANKTADCPAKEILLIDDSRANLMAAEKAGWRVLWFDYYRPAESIKRIREALEY